MHEYFMNLALLEAKRGTKYTHTNPLATILLSFTIIAPTRGLVCVYMYMYMYIYPDYMYMYIWATQ